MLPNSRLSLLHAILTCIVLPFIFPLLFFFVWRFEMLPGVAGERDPGASDPSNRGYKDQNVVNSSAISQRKLRGSS